MAEAKKNILTYEGLQKLEAELEDLKVNKRKEVAAKIKEAREQGDLSENAEYDAAKDEQRDIEARIEEIEQILKNVEVVGADDIDDKKINVGCHIKIYDFEYDEELEFSIVGSRDLFQMNHLLEEHLLEKKLVRKLKLKWVILFQNIKFLKLRQRDKNLYIRS